MNKIIGYKVFNQDFKCRDFQFELGKTYTHEGEIELCKSGFHFCLKLSDCFSYYTFNIKNIVCQVECENVSEETDNDSKRVCGKITIVKQLNWHEVLDLVNTGSHNTGFKNSGHYNSGNYNSGYYNSGYYNSGNNNSGNYNSGHFNSGNYNSGHHHAGCFNSQLPEFVYMFNKPILFSEFQNLPSLNIYLDTTLDYKLAWYTWWNKALEVDKNKIKNLPNFDKDVFKEITGIDI